MNPEILYEDDDLLVCNKPAGLLVIADRYNPDLPNLSRQLSESRQEKLWVVHRIDRFTSGLVCLAKSESSHRYLSVLWEKRQVDKQYLGLVNGRLVPSRGRIDQPLIEAENGRGRMKVHPKGKPAITEYQVLQQWSTYAWVQWQLITGRTHQIRVHMQSLGHALVCDPLYGNAEPLLLSSFKKQYRPPKGAQEERPLMARLALHASRLRFLSPKGESLDIECPLPKDLKASLAQLSKWQPTLPIED